MEGKTAHTILDHVTDVAGIAALAHLAAQGEPVSDGVIGAIVTISVGQRYAKAKWTDSYTSESADGPEQQ